MWVGGGGHVIAARESPHSLKSDSAESNLVEDVGLWGEGVGFSEGKG